MQTAIFKEPVQGPVTVKTLNLEGDAQADLSVHGGVTKAVYIYPSEHYSFWRRELSLDQLPWGMFGENLTTDGLLEDHVYIGDEFVAIEHQKRFHRGMPDPLVAVDERVIHHQ